MARTLPHWPGTGRWIAASHALRRAVPVDDPYPHICGVTLAGMMTGILVALWERDCSACADRRW